MSAGEPRTRAPSAADLIRAIAQQRDRDAFAALFSTFAPKVMGFLVRRGASAPEELTQEVMLAVWRRAETFDPSRGSGEAWLFTIARNVFIDAVRRGRGQPLLAWEDFDTPAEAERGDEVLEQAQSAQAVQAALRRLPPEQYEVVRLSFFEDRPHAEISDRLGLPLGTVKSRLRLAMIKLRQLLEARP